MLDLEAWYASGERVPLAGPESGTVHLFSRVVGAGPWLTLVHGFPMCSWDWAGVADSLSGRFRLLMPDLLGFGDSDKPPGHRYSLVEQADLLEALWHHHGIEETHVVASDIGGSVVQELLARSHEGRRGIRLSQVALLNCALYHAQSRPGLMQRLLARPIIGPMLGRVVTRRSFRRTLSAVFAPAHPLREDTADAYWAALRRRSPDVHIHKLLSYIPERERQHARWEQALQRTTVPLGFVWGMSDPVSGAAVADQLRRRLPSAELVTLADVGHYPHVEVPDQVGAALMRLLDSRGASA